MQGGLSWAIHAKYQAVISLLLVAVVFMTTQEICFVRMAYAERHSSKVSKESAVHAVLLVLLLARAFLLTAVCKAISAMLLAGEAISV